MQPSVISRQRQSPRMLTPADAARMLRSQQHSGDKDVAMAMHTIRIDRSKRLHEEPHTGHNRWHPDIPPVLCVEPGDTVVLETRDALDGAITPTTTVADLHRVDLNL